jgi:HAE1 family hydrophobic/amphiphilic exporter-1
MATAGYGFTRIPTGFLPTEDQGYLIIAVQLPDAASLQRTDASLAGLVDRARQIPGVDHVISIGGISPLDNNTSLANAALVYVILKDWKLRGRGQDLLALFNRLTAEVAVFPEFSARVLPPPPINGLGLSGGFQMQVELTDGSGDLEKLARATDAMIAAATADPRIQLAFTSFRLDAPAVQLRLNAFRAEGVGVTIANSYSALQSYLGSSYVNQFPKFGQNYGVYVEADEPFRRDFAAIGRLNVRASSGAMAPIGAFTDAQRATAPPIVPQYNLMPSAAINGAAARGHSSGEALNLMEGLAKEMLPPGVGFEWTAMSYQERLVGRTVLADSGAGFDFGSAVAGRYRVGAVAGRPSEQYLCPDRPGAAHRAVGQKRHPDRRSRP